MLFSKRSFKKLADEMIIRMPEIGIVPSKDDPQKLLSDSFPFQMHCYIICRAFGGVLLTFCNAMPLFSDQTIVDFYNFVHLGVCSRYYQRVLSSTTDTKRQLPLMLGPLRGHALAKICGWGDLASRSPIPELQLEVLLKEH